VKVSDFAETGIKQTVAGTAPPHLLFGGGKWHRRASVATSSIPANAYISRHCRGPLFSDSIVSSDDGPKDLSGRGLKLTITVIRVRDSLAERPAAGFQQVIQPFAICPWMVFDLRRFARRGRRRQQAEQQRCKP